MFYKIILNISSLTLTASALAVLRDSISLIKEVASGENQRSTCEAEVKSLKSKQIYQDNL